MRIGDLTVDDGEIPLCEPPGKDGERCFRGVRDPFEHRLAEESRAETDPIDAACQLTVAPRFCGMRKPSFVQRAVGVNHIFRDPRPFAFVDAGFGARAYDCGKRLIKSDRKTSLPQEPPKAV